MLKNTPKRTGGSSAAMQASSRSSRCRAVQGRLAGLHAAAGQVPAGHVGVADQENPVLLIEHDPPDPQGHAPGEAPIGMKPPGEQA